MFHFVALTATQKTIVAMLARGLTLKEIATQMGRTRAVVNYHAYEARQRVGVKTNAQLVALAVKHGHVDPEARDV